MCVGPVPVKVKNTMMEHGSQNQQDQQYIESTENYDWKSLQGFYIVVSYQQDIDQSQETQRSMHDKEKDIQHIVGPYGKQVRKRNGIGGETIETDTEKSNDKDKTIGSVCFVGKAFRPEKRNSKKYEESKGCNIVF
jgi:hypothetical protein